MLWKPHVNPAAAKSTSSNNCLEDDAPLHSDNIVLASTSVSGPPDQAPEPQEPDPRTFFRIQEQSMCKLTFLGETSVQSIDFFGQVFNFIKKFADTTVAVFPTESFLIAT